VEVRASFVSFVVNKNVNGQRSIFNCQRKDNMYEKILKAAKKNERHETKFLRDLIASVEGSPR
jgi:hypothetical protein